MRILLWHGYLLGGTGSNVYTRALAREWSRAGHDVTVFAQEPQARATTTSAARSRAPGHRRAAAGLRPRPLRGHGGRGSAGPDRGRARALRDGERRRARERTCPPTSSSRTTSLLGGPVGGGDRRALRGQGARLGARVLDARERGAVALGERVTCGRRGRVRRLRAHPPGARGGRRPRRPRARGPAGRRHRRVRASCRATRRCATLLDESRARSARTRATRASGCPTRATRSGSSAFLAEDEPTVLYFGKLSSNKGVHVLLEALRERRRAGRRSSASATTARSSSERHRRARSSPARWSTATSSHLIPLADVTVVPSIFPEAFGMVAAEAAAAGSPAARRAPLRPRGDRRRSSSRVSGAPTAT